MKLRSRRWWLLAAAVTIAVSAITASQALGGSDDPPAAPGGLGQLSGLLGRDHLTMTSIIQVGQADRRAWRGPRPAAPAPGRPAGA